MTRTAWGLAAVMVAGVGGWGIFDAVRDLAAAPDFAGVLRLVVEAVGVAVVLGFCLGRARRGTDAAPDGDRTGGAQGR